MKKYMKRGLITIAGIAVLGMSVFSFSSSGIAGTVRVKCVDRDTGNNQPAEFNARVKDSVDSLYTCTSPDGSGCEISVPGNGPYEVRCFPFNTEYGQPTVNISIIQGGKQYDLETPLFIVDDGASVEFKSYLKGIAHSTYSK